MKTFKKHPIFVYKSIIEKMSSNDLELEFSKYVYKMRGITDKREIINIPAEKLSGKWLIDMISTLSDNEEFACHSKVLVGGDTWHVPLIDFVVTDIKKIPKDALDLISRTLNSSFFLFSSGTSYHGYFNTIVSKENWLYFIGEILLLNNSPKYQYNIVDSRWVGHALQQGFAALRWSNKTKRAIPKLVK